jgi:uncharacterized repeat protein (TIGR01451 family)
MGKNAIRTTEHHPLSRFLLAGAVALALVLGLSLFFSRFSALAQPAPEVTALMVEKTVNTNVAAPGDVLTYVITIQDVGAPDGTVWLTDTLPAELVYVTDSLNCSFYGSSYGVQGDVITWTATMYGNDQTAIIAFSARISITELYTRVQNTAQIATSTGYSIEVSSEETQITSEMGNLNNTGTRKWVSSYYLKAGDSLTYTITLNNDKDIWVRGVQVVDEIPALLTLVTQSITHTSGSYIVRDGTITWTLDVAAGPDATESLSFQALVPPDLSQPGWVINVAEIYVPGESFSRRSIAQALPRSADLDVSKSVEPEWARPGEYLTYTVRITNAGDGPAFPIWMTDTLPVELHYVRGAASMGVFGESNGVITWNVTLEPGGTLLLPPDQTATLTYTVLISNVGCGTIKLFNHAVITGDGELQTVEVLATSRSTCYLYLPIIYRRWPPIPYIPTLYDIVNPNKQPSYTVQWHYDYDVPVTYYILQESHDSGFPVAATTNYTVTPTGVETSKAFTGKADGTYYYRVRGHNSYGPGGWSNVKSVVVYTIYYDDFSNSNSGWPQRATLVIPSSNTHFRLRYEYGHYRIMIDQGGPPIWFHQPDALAPYIPPSNKYCVETTVRFEKLKSPYDNPDWNYYPYWGNAGLIFGANAANTHLYALCLAVGSQGRMGWFLVNNPTYEYPKKGCNYVPGKLGGEDADTIQLDANRWHNLQVGVDGDQVTVYVNGNYKGRWTMNGLSAMTRVGVVGGDYEITPVDIRYDYFKVTPNQACVPNTALQNRTGQPR